MATFEKSQRIVGLNEGGYQIDPRDDGNYYGGVLIGTNWGVSAPTFAAYLGRAPLKAEMQNMSRALAEKILKAAYWTRNHFDALKNQSLATLLYDGAVNQGNSAMRTMVHGALVSFNRPMAEHEVFTLKGIDTINRVDAKRFFSLVKRFRKTRYEQSKKTEYIESWLTRLDRIRFYPTNTFSTIWPYAAFFFVGIGLILITTL